MEELRRPAQRWYIWSLAAVVALGIFLLIPPAALAGTYSIFEASLFLLAITLVITRLHTGSSSPVAVPTALLGLLVVMTASTLWSSASLYTLRDSLSYIALAGAAWLLVRHGGLQPIIVGILVSGIVILLASVALWFIDPAQAVQWNSHALHGIYGNRNQLGFVMMQCLPAVIALPLQMRGAMGIRLGLIAVFFGAIVVSQSKTSLIGACLVIVGWAVLALLKRSMRYAIGLAAIAVVGIVVATLNWSLVLQILGKDATLNGRFPIWDGLLELIREHPILGSGFLREWPGGSAQSVAVAEHLGGLQMIHAHNEVLSWLSGTGALGLILVVSLYGFAYWAGWHVYRSGRVAAAIWLPLTMLMSNVRGLTETSETNPQGWFVFVLVLFACARFLPEVTEKPVSRFVLVNPTASQQASPSRNGNGRMEHVV